VLEVPATGPLPAPFGDAPPLLPSEHAATANKTHVPSQVLRVMISSFPQSNNAALVDGIATEVSRPY